MKYVLAGSSGSSEGERALPLAKIANTLGSTNSVATVASARPPTTARPSGAVWSPPSPRPRASGIMPAIIAQLVIKIGRSRERAPSMAAVAAGGPPAGEPGVAALVPDGRGPPPPAGGAPAPTPP